MPRERVALYAGTFDPLTKGHFDIIERALKLFETLVLAVADSEKSTMFTLQERIAMVEVATAHLQGLKVVGFSDLTVELAKKHNAEVLIRGLRGGNDFEYELQLAALNRTLDESVETLFLISKPENSFISSSAVRSLLKLNAKTEHLLPSEIEAYIKERN